MHSDRRPIPRGAIALIAAAAALAAYAASGDSLLRWSFASGWCVLGILAWLAARWWLPRLDAEVIQGRVRFHLLLNVVLIAFFAIHVDLRVPNGWLDAVMTVLFAGVVVSSIVGGRLTAVAPQRVPAWLYVHVPLLYGLLCIGLVHGILVHTHGLFAHLVLGK